MTPMEPPTRKLKVSKVWQDKDGKATKPPKQAIEVALYRNGEKTEQTITLDATNKWTGQFKNLDVAAKLGSTEYYQYTVKEVGERGQAIQHANKW
ncbi:collagen-binding protein, partial [Rhizobium sp. KAs_5_22]